MPVAHRGVISYFRGMSIGQCTHHAMQLAKKIQMREIYVTDTNTRHGCLELFGVCWCIYYIYIVSRVHNHSSTIYFVVVTHIARNNIIIVMWVFGADDTDDDDDDEAPQTHSSNRVNMSMSTNGFSIRGDFKRSSFSRALSPCVIFCGFYGFFCGRRAL